MKRMTKRWLAMAGVVALMVAVQGCSANRQMKGDRGFQGSPSGEWGSSITFGVHSHGRGW